MAEVVNLRLARKARARADAARVAEENRARHGEGKAQKKARLAEAKRAGRALDGARIDRDEP